MVLLLNSMVDLNWCFSSVQFSRSVVSDSLRPCESEHTRPPCPSPTPGLHSDSHPSSPWCHPAIASSVVPFSSCPQSLPASESFPMNQLLAWGGKSTGVSALASFLPKKSQFIVVQKVPNRETIIALLFCHPAYFTYMQSTSCDILGWMKHKLESTLLGEWRRTKKPPDESERGEWKSWFKAQYSEN